MMSENHEVLIVNVDPDHHNEDSINTKIIKSSPPGKKNITKVNLDYNDNNDNKTIITINGNGGEILWSPIGYEGEKITVNGGGNIWIEDQSSSSRANSLSHDESSDHGSSPISSNLSSSNVDGDHQHDVMDDEEDGEEFNLSDSEFEEILDDDDDNDGGDDDKNYQSCDNSAINEDMIKNTSHTDNDDEDNDKMFSTADTVNENLKILSNNDEVVEMVNGVDNDCSHLKIVDGGEESSPGVVENCDKFGESTTKVMSSEEDETERLNESVNLSLVNRSDPSTVVQNKSIKTTTSRKSSIDFDDRDIGSASSRRQSMLHTHNMFDDDPEDDVFVDIMEKANEIAEARLAARRQARAEAREIRMRELERQQKEQEQNADRVFDMQSNSIDPLSRSRISVLTSTPTASAAAVRGNSLSSRRSSEDSLEEEGRSLRDLRHELKDYEERFRKAMIANAQSDNERSAQSYQIQLLKDKLEEMEETSAQLQRELKEKSRDHDALKRNNDKLGEELRMVQAQLNERDTLIAEQGLVIVIVEDESGTDAKRALVSVENANLLESTQGSLDVRLKLFAEEKKQLQQEVEQLSQQLVDAKSQGRRSGSANGPLGDDDFEDAQRESNKLIADYKYKLQKAEQEIASLQASLARSETQVIRYKSTAEAAEKSEADLKIERRKLQRENREVTERLEEVETSNNHLLKRLDKLKNAKSALLKEL